MCLNKICYNKRDLEKNHQKTLKILTNRGYDKTETMSYNNKTIVIPENEILNKNPTENSKIMLLIVTFNPTPRSKQIKPKLEENFKNPLLLLLKEPKISKTSLEAINFTIIKN